MPNIRIITGSCASSPSKKNPKTLSPGDILNDLERFEYTLMASFSESDDHPNLLDRFEGLMRFLNP